MQTEQAVPRLWAADGDIPGWVGRVVRQRVGYAG